MLDNYCLGGLISLPMGTIEISHFKFYLGIRHNYIDK